MERSSGSWQSRQSRQLPGRFSTKMLRETGRTLEFKSHEINDLGELCRGGTDEKQTQNLQNLQNLHKPSKNPT